jgi:Ala-tRNA(Pro) deacylase
MNTYVLERRPIVAIPSSVIDYLQRSRVPYAVVQHPVAYTAQEEAAVTHVPGHLWAKAVVCIADGQPLLAVVPATLAVDLKRLREILGTRDVRLARETEIESLYPDCELGAMPPFGTLYGQRVVVDQRLARDPEIVFNGGSHRDAIRMQYGDFEALVKPMVAGFAAPMPVH